MKAKYRKELKIILNSFDAELIRGAVAKICVLDEHVNTDGVYDIKNIYFDTKSDSCLYDTIDGVNLRHKYRVRKV